MLRFRQAISQLIDLSEEARQALEQVVEVQSLPKGYILVRQGAICDHVFFVEEGLSCTFYYKDDKDITDWLSPEGTFAASIVSFLSRQPDVRNVQLLEPSVVCCISWQDLEMLYSRYHEIERLGRLLVSMGIIQLQRRFDDLHFATAAERYHRMMEQSPSLILRVPLGMVASYLGMTQETLSRTRNVF